MQPFASVYRWILLPQYFVKSHFILSDKKHKDALRDYPFNFSDLIVLGDIYEKSVRFMISGME